MGLDMYLERCNRKVWGYKDMDIEKIKVDNPALYEDLKPYIHQRGQYCPWESLFEEVGYWRKANAIHKWFVDNVQHGVDDCEIYEVSKEQLKTLLNICKTIQSKTIMSDGWVANGKRFENGMWCPIYEEGRTVVNPEVAHSLLPTQNGFFFGSTDYDQWYMDDIEEAVNILTKVLETTDFDTHMIAYMSSW